MKHRFARLALVALAAVVVAAADAPAVWTAPDWKKKPTDGELFDAWPKKAVGVSKGRGLISCIVTVEGLLRDCKEESETPEGSGFASAAIALSPQFVFKPATRNGVARETRINIPVVFDCHGQCPGKTPGSRTVVSGLHFAQAPTYQQVAAAYPAKARAKRLAGTASLQCAMRKTGALLDCTIMSETPNQEGFGAAAQELVKRFQTPINIPPDLKPEGLMVRLTFAFPTRMLDGGKPIIGKPKFDQAPTGAQLIAAYPKKALAAKVMKGTATVECMIGLAGVLEACKTDSENPVDNGFGDAVLSVMPLFRMATWTDEGLPVVGGAVRIPIIFELKDAPTASATPSP